MAELTLSLITLSIAATLQPPQVIAMVVLVQPRQGTANCLAYIAGMNVFRLVLGVSLGYSLPGWRIA